MQNFSSDEQKSFARLKGQGADFFPYTCHLDEYTILTKNSHLIQTIKVTGFHGELVGNSAENGKANLRDLVRNLVKDNIKSSNYAIWLHTIRTKKDLSLPGSYDDVFTKEVNKSWIQYNNWNNKYVNELYISIIREISTSKEQEKVKKSLSYTLLKKREKKIIAESQVELEGVVQKIYSALKDFGAKRLKLLEIDGVYYSQFSRFVGKIANFEAKNRPLIDEDLSTYIPTAKIAFGGDAYEVQRNDGKKYFGAIFTLKEYSELSVSLIDKFLQLPQEFFITQTFSVLPKEDALKNYKEQEELLEVSGSKRFAKSIGLDKIIELGEQEDSVFGQNQITINLFHESTEGLAENIEKFSKVFNGFGLVIVRENVFLESCYWSQFPANFFYVIRKSVIDLGRFAGFSSLYNHPAGNLRSEAWGDAITIFYTANKTPYFFNYHLGKVGHSLILGPKGSGKTVLLNFLVAQSLKHKPKLFYVDYFNSSEVFIQAIGGYYENFDRDGGFMPFNPFSLQDTEGNREFLERFLGYLMLTKQDIADGAYKLQEKKRETFKKVIDKVYALPSNERSLEVVAKMLKDTPFAALIEPWVGEGEYGAIFDNLEDDIAKYDCLGIDFTIISEKKSILLPLLAYYLHKIETLLDGKPAIIVIEEAWRLLDNMFFAPFLKDFLNRMSAKNAVVIFASESMEDVKESKITSFITAEFSTNLFLPYADLDEDCKKIFNLTDEEYEMLLGIKNDARHFMLKSGDDSILVELDLTDMEHIVSMLSSNDYALEIKEKVQKKVGTNPEDWVPIYFEVFKDIMKIDAAERSFDDAIKEVNIDSYHNRASREAQEEISRNIAVNRSSLLTDDDDDDQDQEGENDDSEENK